MRTSEDLLSNELEINSVVESSLLDTAKWGKFLAIAGFVSCGVMVLAGVWIAYLSRIQSAFLSSGQRIGMVIGYMIGALIFFFPCLFLFRYAVKMQPALRESNQESLESASVNLKAFFRYMGIVTIIMMFFWILGLVSIMGR